MARIVCQVIHRPGRVTFVWSEGAASFEPYHFEGHVLQRLYQAAREGRQALSRCVPASDPRTALELARAGHRLFQTLFPPHGEGPHQAREILHWLHDLYNRQELTTLDLLGDMPGRIPWNIVYDQLPDEQAFESGDPAARRHFWGLQYALAAGRRVNPLRMASVLESPSIVLAADPVLLERLPLAQRKLGDFAIAGELSVVDTATSLRNKLQEQAPDILYILARMDRGGLLLGDERITTAELRDLLSEAREGNPDPLVLLQACGDPAQWETWECFLGSSVHNLAGVVTSEVPLAAEAAHGIGLAVLTQFLQSRQGIGQVLKEARAAHDLAGLAYSAFCPAHVKVARDETTEPDIPGPKPIPLPAEPYRPLAPFEAEDRALFTGREDDTVRCAGLLDEAATRGLLLHGAAGVGKSSFLRAGIIPHLETEAVGYWALRDRTPEEGIATESACPVVAIRPGSDLTGQLAAALCAFCAQPYTYTTPTGQTVMVELPRILEGGHEPGASEAIADPAHAPKEPPPLNEGPVNPARLWRLLQNDSELLGKLLDDITRRLPFELVLLIEQGEDLVTQVTEPAEKKRRGLALEMLAALWRSPARCKVLMEIRTEHLGRLSQFFPPGKETWRGYFLGDLREEQMIQALVLPTSSEPVSYSNEIPFQKYGFSFENGVAEDAVREAVQAARDRQSAPLPLIQALGSLLKEKVQRRATTAVNKGDLKDMSPVGDAVARHVEARIRDLPVPRDAQKMFRTLLEELYARNTDGTLTRELVPYEDLARSWKTPVSFRDAVDAASDQGLVEVSQLLVDGRERLYVGLPQESLARVADQWQEDRKRQAFGRTKVMDTLWIMIPMVLLAAALVWTFGRRSSPATAEDEGDDAKNREQMVTQLKFLLKERENARWPLYVGAVARAEEAWRAGNTLQARQHLLSQQALVEGGKDESREMDLRGFDWYYLWRKIHGEGRRLLGHRGVVAAVAVSPDGKTAASASLDGTLKLWNLAKGEENATLKGHEGPIHAVAFSPDGKTLASAGADKTVRLWDATAGQDKHAVVTKEQKLLAGHKDAVLALAFGKDPQVLASGGADKLVILWNADKGKEDSWEQSGAVQALAFAPGGKQLAVGGAGANIVVRDIAAAKVVTTIETPGPITALLFGPEENSLISGGVDKTSAGEAGIIRFWNYSSGKETGGPLRHVSAVLALGHVPKTKLLASAGKDTLIRLWTMEGKEQGILQGHLGWVGCLAVSPDGARLVSGSYDGTAKVWDGPSAQAPDSISAHEQGVQALAFSGDSRIVASAGGDGTIKFWDPGTGTELGKLSGLGNVTSLAFTAKGSKLAAGTLSDKEAGGVKVWDVTLDPKDGLKTKELPALQGHSKGVSCLTFAPDDKTLATGSADKTVILWDVESGKPRHTLKGHQKEVLFLTYNQDGKYLMTAGKDNVVFTWATDSGKLGRVPIALSGAPLTAMAYCPPTDELITASADQTLRLWEADSPKTLHAFRQLRPHTQAITCLVLGPGRDVFASGSTDGTIKVFNLRFLKDVNPQIIGEERMTFRGHTSGVRALAISPDRLTIASGDLSGRIRFWRAAAASAVE